MSQKIIALKDDNTNVISIVSFILNYISIRPI